MDIQEFNRQMISYLSEELAKVNRKLSYHEKKWRALETLLERLIFENEDK